MCPQKNKSKGVYTVSNRRQKRRKPENVLENKDAEMEIFGSKSNLHFFPEYKLEILETLAK